jgi:hypothetical protein
MYGDGVTPCYYKYLNLGRGVNVLTEEMDGLDRECLDMSMWAKPEELDPDS